MSILRSWPVSPVCVVDSSSARECPPPGHATTQKIGDDIERILFVGLLILQRQRWLESCL